MTWASAVAALGHAACERPTSRLVTGAGAGHRPGRARSRWSQTGIAVAVGFGGNEDGAAETASSAGGDGSRVAVDVTDAASVDAAFERSRSGLGPVEVLVNNAGVTGDGLLHAHEATTSGRRCCAPTSTAPSTPSAGPRRG